MNRVLISGGWGYGNLGDDAILASTIKLLKTFLPEASLTIMTYDPIATQHALAEHDIEFIPSLHRHLMGETAFKRFGHISSSGRYHPINDALRRISAKLQLRPYLQLARSAWNSSLAHRLPETILEPFDSTHLFVQSGGGYMNSRWVSSVIAHSLELHAANSKEAGILVIGQSIGPFKIGPFQDKLGANAAKSALALSDFIGVRDPTSARELEHLGLTASVIPDLALADMGLPAHKRDGSHLTIVIGALPKTYISFLAGNIGIAARRSGLRPLITISRLWRRDIANARYLRQALLDLGLECDLHIPNQWEELEESLINSHAVLSTNLHALILAWRSGVPVVAIGENRKIRAFMQQIGHPERIAGFKEASSGSIFTEMLEEGFEIDIDLHSQKELAREVVAGFSEGLEAALSGSDRKRDRLRLP